ncbi:MAG TPA: hypothetical protein PKN48_10710 [Bacteroidales bacterium]|nr:hypothetical protein [Bacteroidales bacterium]
MMNQFFDLCVWLLQVSANFLGISYQAINIWLFVIIHPLITLLFLLLFVRKSIKYNKLKKNIN